MGKRLLKGGHVVDPVNGRNGVFDVLIEDGRIARVGRDLPRDCAGDVVEVPSGLLVCPGLIDMHVHLREPGQEHKETVATGAAAAAAGGFTAVACMPNTVPVNDNAGVTGYILQKAAEANLVRVYPIGAVSRGQQGEQLADIAELKQAGCVAVTDDGRPVATALLMRRALEYTRMFEMPVIEHCEEQTLKADGVAHEGFQATTLGLRGIPGEAESIMALRDISLAELTGGTVHIAHMSARQTLDAVRYGKSRGVRVTCEVTPHHFVLTDEMLAAPVPYDTNVKMNPPLREAVDRDAIAPGARRRQRRRHRDRPRATPLRREAGGVRPCAVRHHRARDGRVALLRSAGPPRHPRVSRGSSSCCRSTRPASCACREARCRKARRPTSRSSPPTST